MKSLHLGNGVATTRMFEALLRLTQAHARLMWHSHVTLEDAVAVARSVDHVVPDGGATRVLVLVRSTYTIACFRSHDVW